MKRLSFIIYGLVDPRDGSVRYVGQSQRGLDRPREHCKPGFLLRDPNRHKANWIRKLLGLGLCYDIVVLLAVRDIRHLDQAERFWIAEMRHRFGRLMTNLTDGGMGWRHTPETKAKISAANSRPKPPEEQERLRKLRCGAKMPPEAVAIIASKNRGQRRPPRSREWCERLAAGNRGKSLSPEHRGALSKAGKGHTASAETKAKMGQNMRKVIERVDAITGEVREYRGLSEVGADGFSATSVSTATNNEGVYRGFLWRHPNGKKRGPDVDNENHS